MICKKKCNIIEQLDRVKRIWYLSPMRAAKVQAHPRSLARTSAARSYKQWIKRNLQTESQIPGPSEWLSMRNSTLLVFGNISEKKLLL